MDFQIFVLITAMMAAITLATILCVDKIAPNGSRLKKVVTYAAFFGIFVVIAFSFIPPEVAQSNFTALFGSLLGAFLGHRISLMLKK